MFLTTLVSGSSGGRWAKKRVGCLVNDRSGTVRCSRALGTQMRHQPAGGLGKPSWGKRQWGLAAFGHAGKG